MRIGRIRGEGPSYYHVMSRVVDRRFIFTEAEKERFGDLMRRLERFSGVDILTYSLMSNHFHLLVHVPPSRTLSDEELRTRLEAIYSPAQVREIMKRIEGFRAEGREDLAQTVRESFLARMYDLSVFVKELKQRYTQSYNRRHRRRGTLWEERFKSVLIEGSHPALLTVAAYIDLNPVRAGMVKDPAAYRFCGYGEAIGGGHRARWGLRRIISRAVGEVRFEEMLDRYRGYLVAKSGPAVSGKRPDGSEVTLSVPQVLRYRVRYFADGAALGSRRFVEDVFVRYRERMGGRRTSGARPMRGADWQGLSVLRDLRRDVIT